ncbi:type I restriction-modification system subunit M N-terminal domain-containing protein [Chlorogloeopsis fritschii]|uniref:type I restriction-modification system subunit M N-terminal domain-containing protein n=1 Tax=Chlorogloeopsis fritschii TaxID=1124 RepID=UPI0002FAA46E|nr:type I restriction-modification system subunit M N-terminal domain-containing protein [Chlorogloeopsis fritschii]
MPANTTDLEKRLWDAADELRANSKLKSSEYSVPVLGLIFLRYADWKFIQRLFSRSSTAALII